MQAVDVMTTKVVSVDADTSVREIAQLMLQSRISAVPVVDQDQQILGIVSEGDLMRRPENETDQRPAWWLESILYTRDKAQDYVKAHGRKASDVMTRNVVAVQEDTALHEIARLLEQHRIKRVPVTREGCLVGIVSRANLLHGLVAKRTEFTSASSTDDRTIRDTILNTLSKEAGISTAMINVVVHGGAVQLWGIVDSADEKRAAQLTAESTLGVTAVENYLGQLPGFVI
jgi:CBS domain-containing protein